MVSQDTRASHLDEARFRALAQAYGGDVGRWPHAERAAALRFMAAAPGEAERILADERALDAALADLPAPRVSADLQARILAQAPRARSGVMRAWPMQVWPARAWAACGGLAAAAAAGVVCGYVGMAATAPEPATDDLAELAWAIDDYETPAWSLE